MEEVKLDHPCKQTCSGWKQGYQRGREELLKELFGVHWQIADDKRKWIIYGDVVKTLWNKS